MKPLKLSSDLEMAILSGMMKGVVPKDAVRADELSKIGRIVLASIVALDKPTAADVALHASEVLGVSKDAVSGYLLALAQTTAGVETADILNKVRDKQLLIDLVNEAGSQLTKGTMDLSLLSGLIQSEGKASHALSSVAERVKDGLPPKPTGYPINSLPYLTRTSGGVMGLWALGGEPGVGKSTLAWQIALDVGQLVPVLVYDFENGFAVMMDHTRDIFKDNLPRIREWTKQIYMRDSIRSLDSDLARVPAPAMIVVDSIQKLPGSVEHRRSSLDRWVHRLEYLKKRGYAILLVSEIGRASYGGDAYIGAYKETGEIEYSADFGLQLLESSGGVEANIVKNRHRPFRGPVAILQRKQAWRFKELAIERSDSMEPQEIN